ncbi:hypothetical protein CN918_26630 [Priestia megaterium]|nr:hypothetical protein CN918_26630 [Priestia megaterium]
MTKMNEDFNYEGYYDIQGKMYEVAAKYLRKRNKAITKENLNEFFENAWIGLIANDFEIEAERFVEHVDFKDSAFSPEDLELNKEYLIVPVDNLKNELINKRCLVTEVDEKNFSATVTLTTGTRKGTKYATIPIDALAKIKEYNGFRVQDKVKIKGAGKNTITDIDFDCKVVRANKHEIPFDQVADRLTLIEA